MPQLWLRVSFLADAAAGDLCINGKDVGPEDLKAWLASHLNTQAGALLLHSTARECTIG